MPEDKKAEPAPKEPTQDDIDKAVEERTRDAKGNPIPIEVK